MISGTGPVIFLILAAVAALCLIILIRGHNTKNKCSSMALGSFKYAIEHESASQRYPSFWNPVYEYTVGETVYLVKFPQKGPNGNSFPVETEISYDPGNPEICYGLKMRGMIVSKFSTENT